MSVKTVREELSEAIQGLYGCYLYKGKFVWVALEDADCDAVGDGSVVCSGPDLWVALNRAEKEGVEVIGELFELSEAEVGRLLAGVDLKGEFQSVAAALV